METLELEEHPSPLEKKSEIQKSRRLPTGSSDPVSFTCTCAASSSKEGGLVLLFYRYFAASPPLTTRCHEDTPSLASFHKTLTGKHALGGKIRVAKEGFNITVGGTKSSIKAYINDCVTHWSFSGLDLSTEQKRREFFKPTPGGCACVFGGAPASVRITEEITPMGVTNYRPESWDVVEELSPEEWHERCHEGQNAVLMDMRNYYESRIGYFIDPNTGEPAVRPQIRRFSQWPLYVRRHMMSDQGKAKQILTFCTGGIRCEKGARFLQERTGGTVATLKGGIAGYLIWMEEEIKVGRKRPEDSLFKGRNYVFDARGSTTLGEDGAGEPVSKCHICASRSDRLSKCRSKGCHLVLVVCATCELLADPRCCQSCLDLDNRDASSGPRPICSCEKQREADLWGGQYVELPKLHKSRKSKKDSLEDANGINIKVKVID